MRRTIASKPQFCTPTPVRRPSNPASDQHFRQLAADTCGVKHMIDFFRLCDVNPMKPDVEGDNALHYAALSGNTPFFDFILTDPFAKTLVDINAKNVINNSNALSIAIGNGHFDLALRLIRVYHADIKVLTLSILSKTNDDQFSILRHAFCTYFCVQFDTLTLEKKASLEALCKLLVSRGLSFFVSLESALPPVHDLGRIDFSIKEEDKNAMEHLELNEEEYRDLRGLRMLQESSSVVFDLLCHEAERMKHSYTKAQAILDILDHEFLSGLSSALKL